VEVSGSSCASSVPAIRKVDPFCFWCRTVAGRESVSWPHGSFRVDIQLMAPPPHSPIFLARLESALLVSGLTLFRSAAMVIEISFFFLFSFLLSNFSILRVNTPPSKTSKVIVIDIVVKPALFSIVVNHVGFFAEWLWS
jgi:hypothetical protein